MGRILGIDVGEKRVGFALSDELSIIASPLGCIEREKAIEYILGLKNTENVDHLVLGLPYLPSGKLGSQAEDIKLFSEELRNKIDLPIEFENEVLSSIEAENRLKVINKKYSKSDIDVMAATIILESYLRRS